jgi:lipoprotein NlpD
MFKPIYWRIFFFCVKKISLLLFNIPLIILGVACSSHPNKAPITSVPQPQSYRLNYHVVAPGDTLYAIAWRYNLDYKNLSKINKIYPPYAIKPGQKIDLKGVSTRPSYAVSTAANPAKSQRISTPVSIEEKPASRIKNKANDPVAVKTKSVKSNPLVWSWPLNGRVISSFQAGNSLNKGIDLAAKLGESVLAAADGEVVYSGSGLRGYGKLLIIKHQNSYLSAYAYNSKLLAKEGDTVKRGQKIAEVGSVGSSSGKLHFEIRHDGVPVDPQQYLPR